MHQYQRKMFTHIVINLMGQGFPFTHGEIIINLIEYFNVLQNYQFAHRLRIKALKQFRGVEINHLRGIPQFIEALQECGNRAKMVTKNKS